MSSDVFWKDFDRLHVVRKLKDIIASFWGVQVNFTDEKGHLKGVVKGKFFNPKNQSCKQITSRQRGFLSCMKTVKEKTNFSSTNKKASLSIFIGITDKQSFF